MTKATTARSRAADLVRLTRRMTTLLVAAGLISISGGAASAQSGPQVTRPALLNSAPEAAFKSKKYYNSAVQKSCNNAAICIVKFSVVPVGVVLRASNINCFANIELQNNDFTIMLLFQGPTTAPVAKAQFPVPALNPQSSIPAYVMNQQFLAFFEPHTQPMLVLNAGQTVPIIAASCILAGDLVAP